MEWVFPVAMVAAAAWAVRWHFKDVETPKQAGVRVISPKTRQSKEQSRRAA